MYLFSAKIFLFHIESWPEWDSTHLVTFFKTEITMNYKFEIKMINDKRTKQKRNKKELVL